MTGNDLAQFKRSMQVWIGWAQCCSRSLAVCCGNEPEARRLDSRKNNGRKDARLQPLISFVAGLVPRFDRPLLLIDWLDKQTILTPDVHPGYVHMSPSVGLYSVLRTYRYIA